LIKHNLIEGDLNDVLERIDIPIFNPTWEKPPQKHKKWANFRKPDFIKHNNTARCDFVWLKKPFVVPEYFY
jgi:hypothetical protein